jgi:hypothetical protein
MAVTMAAGCVAFGTTDAFNEVGQELTMHGESITEAVKTLQAAQDPIEKQVDELLCCSQHPQQANDPAKSIQAASDVAGHSSVKSSHTLCNTYEAGRPHRQSC